MSQIKLASSERGLARHFRIGPANRAYDDPSFEYLYEAFSGVGLRPYAPVHLMAVPDGAGGYGMTWTRRTRIDGDSWNAQDVPLGEDAEQYLVQVIASGAVVREVNTTAPNWNYSNSQMSSDGISGPFTVQVAQVSTRFGPGLFRRITLNE